MTSFGANEDDSINKGRAPYVFKFSGQIYHWIGYFYPQDVHPPRFLQLYMCDTENEVANRLHSFHGEGEVLLSADVVDSLSHMLHKHNEYIRTFKTAKEIAQSMNLDSYGVCLFNVVLDRRYGPPAPGSLGCIVCGDDVTGAMYDIIVYSKSGSPRRVSKLHPTYMPLQYPLLFPYGEEGWYPALNLRINSNRSLTNNMYFNYEIHDRHTYSLILHSRNLFHQYLVDAYTCIEQSRLGFIEHHQQQLRIKYISGVYDTKSKGDIDSRVIGKGVFLPATFVGGPRYMYKHYQDALAICKVHGKPQYFITFTCNVKWPEYRRYMDVIGQRDIQNKPDIIARIFKIKVHAFINFLKEDKTFGDIFTPLNSKKRDLPHCHTLLWVTSPFRIQEGVNIDKYITVELPDPILEPALYRTVTTCMLHGPCGSLNIGTPCMVDDRCVKRFPKPFNPLTIFYENGYVHYRRRAGSYHVLQSGVRTDNGYVVSYNKRLCSRFDAHINVEYCGWNMMIKYLFKYISKGFDRVRFTLQTLEANTTASSSTIPVVVNEIKLFLDGRYICPHEAAWRILNFPIHERDPPVQVLAVHLEGMQPTIFKENSQLGSLIDTPSFGVTTLTEWLENNQRDLTYNDYPSKYSWDTKDKRWIHRTTITNTTIGRLAYVHPTDGELFYLRILLFYQKGCKSFYDIRTVRENTYLTFRDACEALGLTGDDKEWLTAFEEAASWATSSELRSLFCHLLLSCEVGNPLLLWEVAKPKMGDDIAYTFTANSIDPNVILRVDTLEQQILLEIQKTLLASTPSKSLVDFGLPTPSPSLLSILKNRLLLEETNYDTNLLISQNSSMVSQLNPDQVTIYERVVDAERNKNQLLLFVYGYGGDKGLESLINFVYGKDIIFNPSPEELSVRAIICMKNETADQVNALILSKTNSQEVVYNNCDSIKSQTHDSLELDTLYPLDYLNNLHFSGIPSHTLILKVNTPVMLMRNINQREGLCNGTHLIVTQLLPSVIEASIITGISVGKRVYIPRIKFVHNTSDLPFIFIRKQFPIKVCSAMTIKKSQGQSLKKVGLYLTNSVFTRTAICGFVKSYLTRFNKDSATKKEALPFNCTRNVLFKDLLARSNLLKHG
ncbi:uncharacterized protein LOC111895527 [Lactuca sativa]|uniref:uncharacterized protein LOC111895527 n=1 Tax=Lactuca sativa TaxID=4236 RepID=UPI000CD8A15A|nr:uncharacterized protein LOC111895527 [Lactuca sativa]